MPVDDRPDNPNDVAERPHIVGADLVGPVGRLVPRDADQQEEAAVAVAEPRYGDLATYGPERTTHIAFWLGEGRILHAAGGRFVVEEEEPEALREIRRGFVSLRPSNEVPHSS